MKMVIVIYTIPVPYASDNEVIEVYGEPDMGWYEWRVVRARRAVHDSKEVGYGSAEIALRDALNFVTSGA